MTQEFSIKKNNKEIGFYKNRRKINKKIKNLLKKNKIMLFKLIN